MGKHILMIMAAVIVFSQATPSYATYWRNGHRDFRWSNYSNDDCDWGWNWDWDYRCDSNDSGDDQDDAGYSFGDWLNNWDWDWYDCKPKKDDNPVPEPATAGLALMSLGALTAATRRRRK